jgi:hypothetical protein
VLANGSSGIPVSGAVTLTTPQDIATTSSPTFDTIILDGEFIKGSSGNVVIDAVDQASAVNYASIVNSPTLSPVVFGVNGTDNNIDAEFGTKGTGKFRFLSAALTQPMSILSGTSYQHQTDFTFANTAATRTVTFQDSSGTLAYLTDIPSGVLSVSGTANRITSTGGANPIIDIAATYVGQASITTLGVVTTGAWQGSLISPTYGGTGVNNGSNTITLGGVINTAGSLQTAGNFNTFGAFPLVLRATASTDVTLPTTGTLATVGQLPVPNALTETDDTNVTMSLTGSPATALMQAVNMTLGWTGQLSLARGGSAANLSPSIGGIVYSTASAMAILAGSPTANRMLQTRSLAAPAWSTTTWPSILTINQILYSSAADTITGISPNTNSVLVSDGSQVPSMQKTLPSGLTIPGALLTATPHLTTPSVIGNLTFSTDPVGITGVITTTGKNAGVVGEVLSQVVTIAGPVVSATATNIATITLTAGQWLVTGELWMTSPGGTTLMTNMVAGISQTTGTQPTLTLGTSKAQVSYAAPTAGTQTTLPTGTAVILTAGSLAVYLVGTATFTGSAANLAGKIQAVRFC